MEFFTLDERGAIQAVDIHTGEVRTVDSSLQDPAKAIDMNKFQRVYSEAGELVLVPNSISIEDLDRIQGKSRTLPYSPLLAERICEEIANGKSLVEVSKKPGMPKYSIIAKWRRENPEFEEAYKQARKDRAEVYFHKIMEEVDKAKADRDEIALARLKTDIYKFAAKVCAPDDYVEKTSIDAKVAVGTFSIETGIRRDGDPGFNKDETKEVQVTYDIEAPGE